MRSVSACGKTEPLPGIPAVDPSFDGSGVGRRRRGRFRFHDRLQPTLVWGVYPDHASSVIGQNDQRSHSNDCRREEQTLVSKGVGPECTVVLIADPYCTNYDLDLVSQAEHNFIV